jgi:hypothetical protein
MTETAAGNEALPHPTIPIKVWIDVDVGIAGFVLELNRLPGVRTEASCQGGATYGPQVMVTWEDDVAFKLLAKYPMTRLGPKLAYVHPAQTNGECPL